MDLFNTSTSRTGKKEKERERERKEREKKAASEMWQVVDCRELRFFRAF